MHWINMLWCIEKCSNLVDWRMVRQLTPTIVGTCLAASSFDHLTLSSLVFHLIPSQASTRPELCCSYLQNRPLPVFPLPFKNSAAFRFDTASISKILPLVFKAIHNPHSSKHTFLNPSAPSLWNFLIPGIRNVISLPTFNSHLLCTSSLFHRLVSI